MNLYEILGVNRDATFDQIKKAHRRLVKLLHPDANDGVESDEFLKMQQAYEVLSDEKKRADYDRTGDVPGVEPTPEEVAIQRLASSFVITLIALSDSNSFLKQNPIKIMIELLTESQQSVKRERATLKLKIAQFDKYTERFTVKKPNAGFFIAVINQHVIQLEAKYIILDKEDDILTIALDIMDGITFKELEKLAEQELNNEPAPF